MRYFLIFYIKRPDGTTDEQVSIAKRLNNKDLDSASIIMDFATKTVIKASVGSVVAPKDWTRMRDFYQKHYAEIIDGLEKMYG